MVMVRNRAVAWAGVVASALVSANVSAQDYLVAGFSSNAVHAYDWRTGDAMGELQGGVGLTGPLCVRFGPDGYLYVASEGTDSVKRYDATTGAYVDDFVAAGSGGLDGPTSLAWDANGDLYVASFNTDAVLKFDGRTGDSMGTFVAAGDSGLNGPDNGTTFGPDGVLYVPSYYSNRVLKFDGQTGDSLGVFAVIGHPRVLVFDSGYVYITSETSNSVKKYRLRTGAYLGDFVAPRSGGLGTPVGLSFGHDGNLYVTSVPGDNVLRFDGRSGDFIDEFVATGSGGMDAPAFILARGGDGVDCDRVDKLKVRCASGALRATVRTSFAADATLTLVDGETSIDVTVSDSGKAKCRFSATAGEHEVTVAQCPRHRETVVCE